MREATLFLLTLCLVETISGSPQSGILRVHVVDPARARITDATLRLKDRGGDIIKEIQSSAAQPAIFTRLAPGHYVMEVEAENFRPYVGEINIKGGENVITIGLEIAWVEEEVEVRPDDSEKATDPREGAFTNFLSREQIESLPDDPEEMQRALRRIAGPDAVIRVDGFSGGRLPPKSQIASIRIVRSAFDAEFHEAGLPLVDITTRAGGSGWNGSLNFRFNDEALNARHPFAASRRPAQLRYFDGFLSGPIVKGKTSLTVFAVGRDSFDTENIVAVLPGGGLNEGVRRASRFLHASARLNHNLSQTHSLVFTYIRDGSESDNLGVGGFNLRDRARNARTSSNAMRISESGPIGKNLFNQFRLQLTDETSRTTSSSNAPAIIVLDAFSSGGAGVDNISRRQSVHLADNLLFGVGSHLMKVGGLIEYDKVQAATGNNQNGTFTFSSLTDFVLDRPAIFTQLRDSRRLNISQTRVGVFVQDDLRVHKSISLGIGLRYEWQNNLKDNLSPRLSFTWAPGRHARIVFRGGVGLFYNWLSSSDYATISGRDASQPSETIIINPGFPDPFLNEAMSNSLPRSFWMLAPDLKNPYVISSSVGVEARVRRDLIVRAIYRFLRGVHQFRSRDVNAPLPDSGRPDAQFGRVRQIESSAFFLRNSLDMSASGGLTTRFSFALDYTLAKEVSDSEGIFSLPSNNYNLQLDRSVSNRDQRHRIHSFFNWNVKRGLNVSAVFSAGSPLPYTITTGRDDNQDTIFNDRPPRVERNSLRGTWQRQIDATVSWAIFLGDREDSGSGGRRIVVTASEASSGGLDMDPTKKFTLRFHISAVNALNQTNLRNFVGVQTSPLFGRPVSANSPRRIETGVRFSF